ncbi:hypothetical protein ACLOJK_015124 [Asimina triloba]
MSEDDAVILLIKTHQWGVPRRTIRVIHNVRDSELSSDPVLDPTIDHHKGSPEHLFLRPIRPSILPSPICPNDGNNRIQPTPITTVHLANDVSPTKPNPSSDDARAVDDSPISLSVQRSMRAPLTRDAARSFRLALSKSTQSTRCLLQSIPSTSSTSASPWHDNNNATATTDVRIDEVVAATVTNCLLQCVNISYK